MTQDNQDKASGKLADQFLAQQMMANLAATHPEGIKPAKELENLRLFAPASETAIAPFPGEPLIERVPSEDLVKEEREAAVYQLIVYVLSIKGGFYSNKGEGKITHGFTEAMLFRSEGSAYTYRRRYDELNKVDTAELLEVTATIRRL